VDGESTTESSPPMAPRARMEAAISLRQPDRVPVFPMASSWPARLLGVSLRQYYLDPVTMASVQVEAQRRLRWDALQFGVGMAGRLHPFFPEAVIHDDDDDPRVAFPPLQCPNDLDRIQVPDSLNDRYAGVPFVAVQEARRQLGCEVPLWISLDGPWQMACSLRGIEAFMLDTVERPSFIEELLAFCFEASIPLVQAAATVGADVCLIEPTASTNLISPAMYARWAAPYERKMADLARACGARQALHICGDTTPILEAMAGTGSVVVDLDSAVSLSLAKATIGDRVCLKGNVDPVAVLLQCTAGKVKAECLSAIAAGGVGGFILSAGCQVAPQTPFDNLYAMTIAAEEYGIVLQAGGVERPPE
jgi:uroporphyrinogen decarboxylase